ncbi:hypothetical protein [Sorangium sp. So ce1182]|uniref:hypothetical protein n=1 Tax=Sorangium sp. So ce1182 TaxID=3133334 RepID=UPI003F6291E3
MGNADITLRHIARRRPGDLARVFAPEDRSFEVLGWIDTQVTKLERRLDKALRLRVGGELRVLHVEFCFAWRDDVPDRIFEYLGFLFTALRTEAPGDPVPPIESVAIVLSGPRQRLPATGKRRTAWPERRFSGTHFHIDAVYQRTIAELQARGSVFWLAFAPLARDANAAAMRGIVAEIHARAAGEDRVELYIALLVMAAIDPWGHDLRRELVMLVEDMEDVETEKKLLRSIPAIAEMIVEAERQAAQHATQQAAQQTAKAIAELLGRLFARRVGRVPTVEEERSIVERAEAIGPVQVEDALLDLEGDALLRWLAEPTRR